MASGEANRQSRRLQTPMARTAALIQLQLSPSIDRMRRTSKKSRAACRSNTAIPAPPGPMLASIQVSCCAVCVGQLKLGFRVYGLDTLNGVRAHAASAIPPEICDGEVRSSPGGGGHVDNGCRTLRFWHQFAVFAQALDVIPDRLSYLPNRVFSGVAGSDAARKIGNVGSVVLRRSLDDDGVSHAFLHSFRPACFMMLAHVPRGRSSPPLPATRQIRPPSPSMVEIGKKEAWQPTPAVRRQRAAQGHEWI